MIGYVINYKDEGKRKQTPSGLLVTHPMTRKIVAVGVSSLSNLLINHFSKGVMLATTTKFSEKKILESGPFDLEGFERIAPLWFDKAKFLFVKIAVNPPLSGFVPVALDLSASYNKEPFEKIQITSGDRI